MPRPRIGPTRRCKYLTRCWLGLPPAVRHYNPGRRTHLPFWSDGCSYVIGVRWAEAHGETCMKIRILVTGGTFDKEYDELTGRLYFQETHLPEMLRLGRSRLDLAIETVMMIDSLDLDDAGRRI